MGLSFCTHDLYGTLWLLWPLSSHFIPSRWCIAICATSRTCQPAAFVARILAKAPNIPAPLPECGHAHCLKFFNMFQPCFNHVSTALVSDQPCAVSCWSPIRDSRRHTPAFRLGLAPADGRGSSWPPPANFADKLTIQPKRSAWKYSIKTSLSSWETVSAASYLFALRTVAVSACRSTPWPPCQMNTVQAANRFANQ